jgi:hypothetical protein
MKSDFSQTNVFLGIHMDAEEANDITVKSVIKISTSITEHLLYSLLNTGNPASQVKFVLLATPAPYSQDRCFLS